MNILEKAKKIASIYHANQKYGEGIPYTQHLNDADETLVKFGYLDLITRAAVYLHDVIEDTDLDATTLLDLLTDSEPSNTKLELEAQEVVMLVQAVTNRPGKNRAERNAATYPAIRQHTGAVLIKLADRISNTVRAFLNGDSKFSMYQKEYKGFREALYRKGEYDAMWSYLDMLNSFFEI